MKALFAAPLDRNPALFVVDALNEVLSGQNEVDEAVVVEIRVADAEDLVGGEGHRRRHGEGSGSITPKDIGLGGAIAESSFVVEEDDVRPGIVVDISDGISVSASGRQLRVMAESESAIVVPIDVGQQAAFVGDVLVTEYEFRKTVFIEVTHADAHCPQGWQPDRFLRKRKVPV